MAKSSRAFDKLAQEYLNAKQEESQRPAFPDNAPSKITEAELARDEEKAAQLILELKVIFDNHPLPPFLSRVGLCRPAARHLGGAASQPRFRSLRRNRTPAPGMVEAPPCPR